ncbi:hypothetical protein GGI16_006265, partial [Coemansia sp. S142-1]
MVRELSIRIPWFSLFDGTAYELLFDYMGETSSLPQARKLHIAIGNGVGKPDYMNNNAIDNTLMLAQFLRSLAPAATLVDIKHEGAVFQLCEFGERLLAEFIKSVYGNTRQTKLDLREVDFKHTFAIDIIPPLTSLKVYCNSTYNVHIGLALKCADTLLELEVEMENSKALFYNADGNVVVYPNLRHLQLLASSPDKPADRNVPGDIVPFPSLRKLVMPYEYPLGDDMLFRGNSATLEHLNTAFDSNDVTMLNKYRVFESKHKVLRIVCIRVVGLSNIPETETSKLLGNMLETVQILYVDTDLF